MKVVNKKTGESHLGLSYNNACELYKNLRAGTGWVIEPDGEKRYKLVNALSMEEHLGLSRDDAESVRDSLRDDARGWCLEDDDKGENVDIKYIAPKKPIKNLLRLLGLSKKTRDEYLYELGNLDIELENIVKEQRIISDLLEFRKSNELNCTRSKSYDLLAQKKAKLNKKRYRIMVKIERGY